MKVHDLKPAAGSRKGRKRVGRGIGGKGGKTAGRGTKGQKARSKVRLGFEGGQLPLAQRVPKLRGFNNPFRVEYQAINLDVIEESGLTEVTPRGAVRQGAHLQGRPGQDPGARRADQVGHRVGPRGVGLGRGSDQRRRGLLREAAATLRSAPRLPRQRPHQPLREHRSTPRVQIG